MSGIDAGTMYQLRNLINRRNVVKNPTDNVSACEDFFLLLTEAHILAAAMTLFSMKELEDTPSHAVFCDSENTYNLQRRNTLLKATHLIIDNFVDVSYRQEKSGAGAEEGSSSDQHDGVKAYASEVLSLGLILMEFIDGIREGDGNRIIRCWQYMLLLFKANKRKNYAIEALNLLIQLNFTLSPRMAAQLKWNRTVNVHGKPGRNVSADLEMEHLNRDGKTSMSGMGSNITEQSVTRIGRAIKILSDTMHSFDNHNGVPDESGEHSRKSSEKDLKTVLKLIFEDTKVFSSIPGRSHKNFPNFKSNSMKRISRKKLDKWFKCNAKKTLTAHANQLLL